jgi:hypothetical protein
MSCEWKTAELLDGLQNGTHKGTAGASDQSIHGRMGLGTACKEETLRMKNISIENSGWEKIVFGLRKSVYPQKNSYIYFLMVLRLKTLLDGMLMGEL